MDISMDTTSSLLTRLQRRLRPDNSIDNLELEDNTADTDSAKTDEPAPDTQATTVSPSVDLENSSLFPSLPQSSNAVNSSPASAWAAGAGTKKSGGKFIGAAAATRAAKNIPEQVFDRFEIPLLSLAKPQNQLGTRNIAPGDICKSISQKTNTNIELSTSKKSGTVTVILSGAPSSVRKAKREVQIALCARVTVSLSVPANLRSHILGAGGRNLKALIAKTMTKIHIPKQEETEEAVEQADEETIQPITITGDIEGVEMARKEIEELVAQRTSRSTVRLEIDQSFHPFIAGPNNERVNAIQAETGARIHLPPMLHTMKEDKREGKNFNEIVITGEKEDVAVAEQKISQMYDELKNIIKSLSINVNKRQHKFVIGAKGSGLQEIFSSTKCFVELPLMSDASEQVTIRGPDVNLSQALNMVMEKARSTIIEDVDLTQLLPSKTDCTLFLRYIFSKHRPTIKAIESKYSCVISHTTHPTTQHAIMEIQAKSDSTARESRNELLALLKEPATYIFEIEEIPRGMHKYIVGKNGGNITKIKSLDTWKGRLIDIVIPYESDESDEVIIVVSPLPNTKNAEKEAATLVAKVRDELISIATNLADYGSKSITVDPKYHGRLIGSGGERLKELLGDLNGTVSVKFPGNNKPKKTDSEPDANKTDNEPKTVIIKGPSKEVNIVADKITTLVSEWRHLEVMNSFQETVPVPSGIAKKLVTGGGSGNGNGIGWLITLVKETIEQEQQHRSAPKLEQENGHLHMRIDIDESDPDHDNVTITGSKHVAQVAKKIVIERAAKLADIITIEVNIFEDITAEARDLLGDLEDDARNKIMRRLIGKEGKNIKKLSASHGDVFIKFSDRSSSSKGAATEGEEEEDAGTQGVVFIKGGKINVLNAKKDIIEFVENEIIHAFTVSFQFARSCLPHVVGKGGSKVMKLKQEHAVRIDFIDIPAQDGEEELCNAILEGPRDACLEVQSKIMEIVDEMINTKSCVINIPVYLHKHVIGPSGTKIKTFIDKFGGPEKIKVQFPHASAGESISEEVIIKAHQNILEQAKAEIEALVASIYGIADVEGEDNAVYQEETEIPRSEVSRIVDRGGKGLKELMAKHNVNIWITDNDESSTSPGVEKVSKVTIVGRVGSESNVTDAKEEILSKLRSAIKIQLPKPIQDHLSAKGIVRETELAGLSKLFKRIRISLSVYPEVGAGSKEIIVRGEKKNIDACAPEIEKELAEFAKLTHTIHIPISSLLRAHVIGRQGNTISKIRTDTGCHIELIQGKIKDASDTVVIRGTEATVAEAQEIIQAIISSQAERAARDAEKAAELAERKEQQRLYEEANKPIFAATRDEFSSNASLGSSSRSIPGFSKKATIPKPKKPVGSPSLSGSSSGVLLKSDISTKNEQWQAVPARNGKAVALVEPTTKKSKKKANKNKAAQEVVVEQPVVASAPVSPSKPATVEKKQEEPVAKKAAVVTETPIPSSPPKKQAAPAAKINKSPSPAPPSSSSPSKSKPIERHIPPVAHYEFLEHEPSTSTSSVVDDDWQVVDVSSKKAVKPITKTTARSELLSNSVALAAAALGLDVDDSSSKKKKKKKKSKNKNGNTGSSVSLIDYDDE